MYSMHNSASKDQALGLYVAAKHERLENHAAQSAANYDYTGCHKKATLYTGQTVYVLNNDRTL